MPVIISVCSLEYSFASTSKLAFILIFLSFIILQSIFLTETLSFKIISGLQLSISIIWVKSNTVFRLLILPFSLSARYIMYVFTLPSILIFPSITSFLYTHAIPFALIIFKTSGLTSFTITSPSKNVSALFCPIIWFIHTFSFSVSTGI